MLPDSITVKTATLTRGADAFTLNKVDLGQYTCSTGKPLGAPLKFQIRPVSMKKASNSGDRASLSARLDDVLVVEHSTAGGGNVESLVGATINVSIQFDRPKVNGLVTANPFTVDAMESYLLTIVDALIQDGSASSPLAKALDGQF